MILHCFVDDIVSVELNDRPFFLFLDILVTSMGTETPLICTAHAVRLKYVLCFHLPD